MCLYCQSIAWFNLPYIAQLSKQKACFEFPLFFNFPGSGGNNHAVEYYETSRYPLAVKLGTITPGGADVYSYDEDDMVLDPNLPQHLAHFGIDMMIMNKARLFHRHYHSVNLPSPSLSLSCPTPCEGIGFWSL